MTTWERVVTEGKAAAACVDVTKQDAFEELKKHDVYRNDHRAAYFTIGYLIAIIQKYQATMKQ